MEHNLHQLSIKVIRARGSPEHVLFYFHGFPGPLPDLNPKPPLAPDVNRETGLEIIAPEYRGLGGSSGRFSFLGSLSDADRVFDHYRGLYPTSRFSVLGYSWGALPALDVWKVVPEEQRRRLVLLAPAIVSPGRDVIESMARDWLTDYHRVLAHYSGSVSHIIDEIEECLVRVSPLGTLARNHAHTSIIHGEQDDVVPFSLSKMVCSQIPGIRLVPLPEQGHDFEDRWELLEKISEELAQ